MDEQALIASLLSSQKNFQETVCEMMRSWNLENKQSQTRIHERLDQILAKEAISRPDCEAYRGACKAATCKKIDEAKAVAEAGIPTWAAVIGGLGASIIVGMFIFIVSNIDKLGGAGV